MANDMDMQKDITDLEKNSRTKKQAEDLGLLYFYRYIEPDTKELERLKKLYVKKYGHLDNYV